jgi:hypothetical protein
VCPHVGKFFSREADREFMFLVRAAAHLEVACSELKNAGLRQEPVHHGTQVRRRNLEHLIRLGA